MLVRVPLVMVVGGCALILFIPVWLLLTGDTRDGIKMGAVIYGSVALGLGIVWAFGRREHA